MILSLVRIFTIFWPAMSVVRLVQAHLPHVTPSVESSRILSSLIYDLFTANFQQIFESQGPVEAKRISSHENESTEDKKCSCDSELSSYFHPVCY